MKYVQAPVMVILLFGLFLCLPNFAIADNHPNLVAWWQLDEGSGDIANNAVSDANGVLINGPVWTSGVSGGALDFDGVDDYIEVPGYTGIAGTVSRTCTAWIKTTSTQLSVILSWGDSVMGNAWYLYSDTAGHLIGNVWQGRAEGISVLNDGQWHHVAMTLGGDLNGDGRLWAQDVQLYVDGQLEITSIVDNSGDPLAAIDTSDDLNVTIGVRNYGSYPTLDYAYYFDGLIDDVRIYDRALTGMEIADVIVPELSVSNTHLRFFARQAGSDPSDRIMTIQNTGGQLNWSLDLTDKPDWLTVTPVSGSLGTYESQPVTFSVSTNGWPEGAYSYTFDVDASDAYNSPQAVTVQLNVGGILVPEDYGTVQAAIDAAVAGDAIFVAPGGYLENITLKNGVGLIGSGSGSTTIASYDSETVVTSTGCDPTTILEGFLITSAGGELGYTAHGMYNVDSDPTISDCIFGGNGSSSTDVGGGMYNVRSNPTVTNCSFISNDAGSGGGMYNSNSDPKVTDCTFSDNNYLSLDYGSGIYNSNSNPIITNCCFTSNWALYGGAIYNNESRPIISNCIFRDNVVRYFDPVHSLPFGGSGAGMYNRNSTVIVTNCLFEGNKTTSFGWLSGGTMYNSGSTVTLKNCTFSGEVLYNLESSLWMTNCILWYNPFFTYDQINNNSSTVAIRYSDIAGCGGSGSGWNAALGTDAGGNIDADPLFVRDSLGLFLKSEFGRVSTTPSLPFGSWVFDGVTSPCIDAGDPVDLVANEPAGNGGRINMGAYGGTYYASRSSYIAPLEGDIDGDGDVDLLDFARFADNWLTGTHP